MLNDESRAILALERRTWRYAGAKEAAIAAELGLTATRYYQRLRALLDDPEALAADPMTVNRLRARLAAQRRA